MGRVNEEDLDWSTVEHGDTKMRRKRLGDAAGGEEIGASLYEIPPGRRSWPYHYHAANAEAMYVIEGRGSVRTAVGDVVVEPGDYLAFPTGDRGVHQVVNDRDEPLRYLLVSTMVDTDVTFYPELGTFGVFVGGAPGGTDDRAFHGYYRVADETDYWGDASEERV